MPIARVARPIRCGIVSAVVIRLMQALLPCFGYECRCCLWREPTDIACQVESTCSEANQVSLELS